MRDDEAIPVGVPGYRILRGIGEGGMGVVYEARAEGAAESVAIKVLRAELADDEDYRRAFRREVRAARRVAHPNIVEIIDSGDDGDPLFLVMRYIDGRTLGNAVGRSRAPIPPATAAGIAVQIAAALDAVHAEGLVHGDVSPANVLLTDPEGTGPDDALAGGVRALLTDFGLARPVATGPLSQASGWAGSGRGAGTPGYMAPETAAGDRLTPRADLWSLGAVLYLLLTGHPPAPGRTRPAEQRARLPRRLDRVVERALSTDPADRYATAREFAAALRRAVPAGGRPDRRARRRPSPLVAGGLVLAVLLVAGALYASARPSGAGHRTRRDTAPPVPSSAAPAPTPSPPPARGAVADRRVVCAEDLRIRDAGNTPTGGVLYRGDAVTVHRRNARGTLAQVTTRDGRSGWVEAQWLGRDLAHCPH